MSLRDLVNFAQNEVSRGELLSRGEPLYPLREPIYPEAPRVERVPAEGNLDTIAAERPPMPGWLRSPQNESVQIGGTSSIIFSEDEFEQPIPPGPVPAQEPDALAYYLPFHFYPDGVWGVYLRTSGVLELAAQLKGSPITHASDRAIGAATSTLIQHELFHCVAEAAATRAEVVAHSSVVPVYQRYFYDRSGTANEEAMANASAHGTIAKVYPAFITALESWMKGQGPGYRDFDRFIGRRFRKGRLVCSQHIVRFVPPPLSALPSRMPSDFLLDRRAPRNVPTYIVIDASLSAYVLRPFPRWNGMLVKAPTRDHPPPHIHVEVPLGNPERRRCIWPSLDTYEGDPPLKRKEKTKLIDYLKHTDKDGTRLGHKICDRLRSVYHDSNLPMALL
jgi:hypothetical protein